MNSRSDRLLPWTFQMRPAENRVSEAHGKPRGLFWAAARGGAAQAGVHTRLVEAFLAGLLRLLIAVLGGFLTTCEQNHRMATRATPAASSSTRARDTEIATPAPSGT